MKNHLRFGVLLGAVVGLATAASAQRRPVRPDVLVVKPNALPLGAVVAGAFEKSPSILEARGVAGTARLGQLVTVRGFYYDGSIPMIVDDVERTNCNLMMPPSTYVPLAAPLLALRSGDEVSVAGRLVAPLKSQRLNREASVLQVEGDIRTAVKLLRSRPRSPFEFDPKFKPLDVPHFIGKIVPTKYAVLLAGGGDSANNHPRFLNDLTIMFRILINRGYDKSNIFVLYADGYATSGPPIYGEASRANVNAVFQLLGNKMTAKDELYVMMDDHGGGFLAKDSGYYKAGNHGGVLDAGNTIGSAWDEKAFGLDLNGNGSKTDIVHFHNTLCLWNETMTEEEFAAALEQVKFYRLMTIQMNQCFSGGFTQFLRNNKRIVMSSAGANELSWAHSSVDDSHHRSYCEFLYWYCSAFMGITLDSWVGANSVKQYLPANADANGDKQISVLEAWNFACKNNQMPETGLYADTPAFPVSGPMPASGQGSLGASMTFGEPLQSAPN